MDIKNQEEEESHLISNASCGTSQLLNFIKGKDELNIAEFPLALPSNRVDPKLKKLEFSDTIQDKKTGQAIERKLTIINSDEHGLPTAPDDEIILALIQLTKLHGFNNRKVEFSRYEILKILGWKNTGYNYHRVQESLEKWLSITIKYQKAWWNPIEKLWMDESFHILDGITTAPNERNKKINCFYWNEIIFNSFKRGNLKSLDFKLYRCLKRPIAKRLFRLLDKRFYRTNKVEFNLHSFAFDKLGVSRNYSTAGLKQQLSPSIQELESIGFLKPLPKPERFVKVSSRYWKIVFEKSSKSTNRPAKPLINHQLSRTFNQLLEFGISKKKAQTLISAHSLKLIQFQIEVVQYLIQNHKSPKNPAGYLVKAIEDNYSPPADFKDRETQYQQQQQQEEKKKTASLLQQKLIERENERKKREEAEAKAKTEMVTKYLNSLEESQVQKLVEQALMGANLGMMRIGGKATQIYKQQLIERYVFDFLRQDIA